MPVIWAGDGSNRAPIGPSNASPKGIMKIGPPTEPWSIPVVPRRVPRGTKKSIPRKVQQKKSRPREEQEMKPSKEPKKLSPGRTKKNVPPKRPRNRANEETKIELRNETGRSRRREDTIVLGDRKVYDQVEPDCHCRLRGGGADDEEW